VDQIGNQWAALEGRSSAAGVKRSAAASESRGEFEPSGKSSLRWDVPVVHQVKRGSSRKLQKILEDPAAAERARASFNRSKFAKTTLPPKKSRAVTFEKIANRVGQGEAYPLTAKLMEKVGGALKAARYRSTMRYLGEARLRHVELGFPWTDELQRSFRLCGLAANRGLGAAKKAAEIRLSTIVRMSDQESAVVRKGPLYAKRSLIVATWWLLREIELAGISIHTSHVEIGEGWSAIHLPASKTDTGGIGKRRVVSCICSIAALSDGGVAGRAICGACAVKHQLAFVCEKMKVKPEEDRALGIPLFVNRKGQAPTKHANVASWSKLFYQVASLAEVQKLNGKIGGHSARRSGAKALCRSKWSLDQVAWHGRWGSKAVNGYVEEVFAEVAESWQIEGRA